MPVSFAYLLDPVNETHAVLLNETRNRDAELLAGREALLDLHIRRETRVERRLVLFPTRQVRVPAGQVFPLAAVFGEKRLHET